MEDLPIFLHPLKLIPHYRNRAARYIRRILQGNNDQLFGPLEQLVTAVVVLGLALRPPSYLYAPVPDIPEVPNIIPNATLSTNTTEPMNITQSYTPNQPIPQTGSPPHPPTLGWMDNLLTVVRDWRQINPATAFLVLMAINVTLMLIPADLKRRLRESWLLFWPPWQDRSSRISSAASRPDKAHGAQPGHREDGQDGQSRAADRVRTVTRDGTRGKVTRKDTYEEETTQLKDKSRGKLESGSTPGKNTAGASEISRLKERERQKRKPTDEKTDSKTEREKLSQSERARRAKNEQSGESGTTPSGSADKKRQEQSDPATASTSSVKVPTEEALSSNTTDPEKALEKYPEKALEKSEKVSDKEDKNEAPSEVDIDDPLMAGDYRPLRSVLKKSKKKPRQSKNIHHNYFMTMRGWRPSLIPFPHGFHPKPHYPRNTLWWDNVPENADHIMAPPPILKAPQELKPGEDEEEKKDTRTKTVTDTTSSSESNGDTSASTTTTEVKKVTEESGGERGKEGPSSKDKSGSSQKAKEQEKPRSNTKGDATEKDKAKEKGKETEKEKEEEQEKEKDRAKLRARAEEEAKARARSAPAESSTSSSSTTKPKPPPMDPQLQKAMYVSQGMLSILLYAVSQQLGLLLLLFFVWQFVNAREEGTQVTPPSGRPHSQPSAAASSSSTSDPSRAPDRHPSSKETNVREIPPEMQEKLDKAPTPHREGGSEGQDDKAKTKPKHRSEVLKSNKDTSRAVGSEDRKAREEVKPSRDGTAEGHDHDIPSERRNGDAGHPQQRTLDDLTPEQRERYLKAKSRHDKGKYPARPKTPDGDTPKKPRRLEDLTEEDKAKYMEERAKRKLAEREQVTQHAHKNRR
ncbi:hypothetical protein BCR39DRAFT_559083 [Naematelia encephala]|uniref:Uncharacterized protein n=1 Tax=Naematelia encephala TaxID=71784 RepID=A0A1Y2B3Y8_9TREE|nr:hypothetical protein BCR39DRAFT_559083 [Naematelia encephala]